VCAGEQWSSERWFALMIGLRGCLAGQCEVLWYVAGRQLIRIVSSVHAQADADPQLCILRSDDTPPCRETGSSLMCGR
jgi:hypothetical protein